MTKRELSEHLREWCGGLSAPEKMPGLATMLPASSCQRGSILRLEPDTVCSTCYACEGRFLFPNVQAAMQRQYDALTATLRDPSRLVPYVETMAAAIRMDGRDFRHFASGDFQSPQHIGAVCAIASLTPDVRHVAHTREFDHVVAYLDRGGSIPKNLAIRISADYIGWKPEDWLLEITGMGSWVTNDGGVTCQAPKNGGKCGSCRACWSRSVSLIGFQGHGQRMKQWLRGYSSAPAAPVL